MPPKSRRCLGDGEPARPGETSGFRRTGLEANLPRATAAADGNAKLSSFVVALK